jgi:hypothetical protein
MFFPNMNEKVKEIRASNLKTSTFFLEFFLKKLQRKINGTFFFKFVFTKFDKKDFSFFQKKVNIVLLVNFDLIFGKNINI